MIGYANDVVQPIEMLIEQITPDESAVKEEEDDVSALIVKDERDELRDLCKATITVTEDNQTQLRAFIPRDLRDDKQQLKSVNEPHIECSKCCRQFVHEGGLHRHWDIHVGEILSPTKPVNPSHITCVILCANCGEVFLVFADAVAHLKSSHVEIIKLSDNDTTAIVKSGNGAGHEFIASKSNDLNNVSIKSGALCVTFEFSQ